MKKYVFEVRSDPTVGVHLTQWLDVTALVGMEGPDELDAAVAVMKRLDPDDKVGPDLKLLLNHLHNMTGLRGELRRRYNSGLVGPLCITWESDDELTPEELEAYINNMTLEQRQKFYRDARF